MSSNGGNRKSMDDVLASIRRIIGAEKKEGYSDLPNDGDDGAEPPLTLGAPISEGNAQPKGSKGAGEPDPLSLTPNMRVDFTKLTDTADETRIARAGGAEQRPLSPEQLGGTPAGREPVAEPLSSAEASGPYPMDDDEDDEAVVIDEAALEDMIRRIVREEIAAAREEEAEIDREGEMRRVVREELMGETGQNISRNVQRMIQAEVARLLDDPG